MWKKTIITVELLLIGIILAGAWFSIAPIERFGIYLQSNNEPVITDEDIVWYEPYFSRIKLTERGLEKIKALRVGVYGEPFTVMIGETEIFRGAFWTPISSVGYSGIVIEQPMGQTDVIQFQRGYPPGTGDVDPRSDPRIAAYFQSIGKLMKLKQ
jgi:hypothetical protein